MIAAIGSAVVSMPVRAADVLEFRSASAGTRIVLAQVTDWSVETRAEPTAPVAASPAASSPAASSVVATPEALPSGVTDVANDAKRGAAGPATQTPVAGPRATDIRISGTQSKTAVEIDLSVGVTAEIFTLANPYRVIVDLPDLAFTLPDTQGSHTRGLVREFRFGLFAEGKARVVVDTVGPVAIASAKLDKRSGKAVTLRIELAPIDAVAFGAGTGSSRSPKAAASVAAAVPVKPKSSIEKPVIVIDAGHGGIDPGAIGAGNVAEKTIVLDVARQLKASLAQTKTFDVRMTRSSDVFLSLDRRLKASQDFGADLFISLHADSIEEMAFAHNVRGATVYTLSERASDEEARKRAEKENASDLIAGLENTDAAGIDQVKNILIDLIKRETSNFSADFSNVVAGKLAKTIAMSRDPQRSAAFKVLKQTHAPSVLIELGYMSNPEDQRQMMTIEWQQKVARAITAAIVAYFNKREPD